MTGDGWSCRVDDLWWLVAGRLKVGTGNLDPGFSCGGLLPVRREDDLLTSLLRGWEVEVEAILGSMGVVEPEWEKANEPLECEMTADAGRDRGAMLESRDLVILLDRRRSHVWGWTFGVLPCELSLPSGGTDTSSAMITLPLALLKLLFTMCAALSERERLKRSAGRAEKCSRGVNWKAKWSAVGAVYVAVAVALISWPGGG
jgi:hypothetical protein